MPGFLNLKKKKAPELTLALNKASVCFRLLGIYIMAFNWEIKIVGRRGVTHF